MATKFARLTSIPNRLALCRNFSNGRVIFNKPQSTRTAQGTPSASQPAPSISTEVPGLSSAVVKYGSDPVGPGASKTSDYKNPEYFCYHQDSYFEAEVEMLKYRCPQPSSLN